MSKVIQILPTIDQLGKRLLISNIGYTQLVPLERIIRCRSEGGYTEICLLGGHKHVASTGIGKHENSLSGYGFYRVSYRDLINLSHLEQYEGHRKHLELMMSDGSVVVVSARRRKAFLEYLFSKENPDGGAIR